LNVDQCNVDSVYSHSLLDAKINSVLSLCHDQVILNAVHNIIQNMIACEDVSQQQLSYLQIHLTRPAGDSHISVVFHCLHSVPFQSSVVPRICYDAFLFSFVVMFECITASRLIDQLTAVDVLLYVL